MWTSTLSFAPSRTPPQFTSDNTSPGEGVNVFDPPEEIPSGPEFIHQLPERTRRAEETAFISVIFDHASQAHEHLSSVCANISALAKITDRVTLHTVINGAV